MSLWKNQLPLNERRYTLKTQYRWKIGRFFHSFLFFASLSLSTIKWDWPIKKERNKCKAHVQNIAKHSLLYVWESVGSHYVWVCAIRFYEIVKCVQFSFASFSLFCFYFFSPFQSFGPVYIIEPKKRKKLSKYTHKKNLVTSNWQCFPVTDFYFYDTS